MTLKTVFIALCTAVAAVASAATPAGSGRVVIAPVQVEFHKDWLADMNGGRGRHNLHVGREDAQRIADEMAASLQAALDEAFRARGFEVVGTATGGAIVLKASVRDLYVNSPTSRAPAISKSYVRDAGYATLKLEGRETETGKVRLDAGSHETAGFGRGLSLANDVSNRFWFDSMFRRWAADQALALAIAK
jgi:hypothetical protein